MRSSHFLFFLLMVFGGAAFFNASAQTLVQKHIFNSSGEGAVVGSIDYASSIGEPLVGVSSSAYAGFLYDSLDIITSTPGLPAISQVSAFFSIYPNPFDQTLTITSSQEVGRAVIYNALGQTVFTSSPGSAAVTVNLPELQAGVYLIQLFDAKGNSIHYSKLVRKDE
jgi:hypothetical protein